MQCMLLFLCNSYAIKATLLMCRFQCILVYSHICATITINSRTLLSLHKESPYSLTVTPSSGCPPATTNLFVSVDLLRRLPINGSLTMCSVVSRFQLSYFQGLYMLYQYVIPFCGQIVFHCMYALRYVYPFIIDGHWDCYCFLPMINGTAMDIHIKAFV